MTQGLNHHSLVFVSVKLHIQRLSGMPRTMVASVCRCILSVIGFGDGTSPEWRPGEPVRLIMFLQKFEKHIFFHKIIWNFQYNCQNGSLRLFDPSEHIVPTLKPVGLGTFANILNKLSLEPLFLWACSGSFTAQGDLAECNENEPSCYTWWPRWVT